jgi:hypothetical protein
LPQIGRHRLIAKQDFDTGLINLLLQLINFLVVGDSFSAKAIISPKQSIDGLKKAAFG